MPIIESVVGLLAVLSDVLSLLDKFLSEGKALNQKIDEKDLRRFRSSCNAFSIAMQSSSSAATLSSHLSHAEQGFLEYAYLDPKRDFGPLPGTRVLAIANGGLATIYETRGDSQLSRKHKLLAFVYEPRLTRDNLFPHFYQSALREQCEKRVNDWYQRKLAELDKKDYGPQLAGFQLSTSLIDSSPYVSRDIKDRALKTSMDTSVASLKLKQQDIAVLDSNIPRQTDEECRELAKQMLRDL